MSVWPRRTGFTNDGKQIQGVSSSFEVANIAPPEQNVAAPEKNITVPPQGGKEEMLDEILMLSSEAEVTSKLRHRRVYWPAKKDPYL